MRKICYTQYINYKKKELQGDTVVEWYCILWSMVQFQCKKISSSLVECMNSFIIQIRLYYEFIHFLQCKINEFIYFCSANK
jgi:hypothetical protein